jgi:hypothetical protein
MASGISTSMQTGADAACLAGKGITFVFRYYSATTTHPAKRLTLGEAQDLVKANIQIGVVYEDGPTSVDYFSNERGIKDGGRAWRYAQQIGQPAGSAIYFAVDYDAPPADKAPDLSVIASYFQGVQSGLDAASGGGSSYSIGVYGSGLVCQTIKQDRSLAKYSWMAESPKWHGTDIYAGWNVMQAPGTSPLCSFAGPTPGKEADYEECQSAGDFGGFTV